MKSGLVSHRRVFTEHGFLPECAYCGKGIVGSPDMNEHFFTRGDIWGNWELMPLIMTDYNCSLVHPGGSASPCHAGIHTKEGQRLAVRHVLKWEGEDQVLHWLLAVATLFRSTASKEAIGLFQSVTEALMKEKELFARLRKELDLEADTPITLDMLVAKSTSMGLIEEYGQPGPGRVRIKAKGRKEYEGAREDAEIWLVEMILDKQQLLLDRASSDRQTASDKRQADKPKPEPIEPPQSGDDEETKG